jgi:hypothetical protein
MKKNFLFAMLFAVAAVLGACNKLEQYPTNKFTDGTYWTSPDKASSVLNMAYSQMMSAARFEKGSELRIPMLGPARTSAS